jgi:hypothetical protein
MIAAKLDPLGRGVCVNWLYYGDNLDVLRNKVASEDNK